MRKEPQERDRECSSLTKIRNSFCFRNPELEAPHWGEQGHSFDTALVMGQSAYSI